MCRTSIYFSEVESVEDHLPKDAPEQVLMNQSGWQLLSEVTVGLVCGRERRFARVEWSVTRLTAPVIA